MKSCPYKKCDGSGLIPLIKNNKVIPGAYHHCDCHSVYGLNPEPEHYHPICPEDYDFPMSETFRGFSYAYCGVPDPQKASQQVSPAETLPKKELWTHKQWDHILQLEAQGLYLQRKLNEHLDKSKKKQAKREVEL